MAQYSYKHMSAYWGRFFIAKERLTMSKKATIEDLIARKLQSDEDKLKIKLVDISDDLALEVRKQKLNKVLSLLDGIEDDNSLTQNVEFMEQLVYESCPMLHDKALLEAYDCAEPYDIVLSVLNDDIGALSNLTEAIMDFYGLSAEKKGENLADELKNS